LSYCNKGSIFVTQGNREAFIEAGDCFLAHSGKPLGRRFTTGSEILSLVLPRQIIQRWLLSPLDITARSLLRVSPFGKALAASFSALTQMPLDELAIVPDAFVEQVCCSLALTAGSPKTSHSTYKRASFSRQLQALRSRCCDPDFDQATFAKEQGLSTRAIQKSFSAAGTGFRRELLLMRLERALWLLDDPRHDKMSIAEIAVQLGYRHSSHFITHFRKAYGSSPAMYRKRRA
jgi:AraC-like DNA-binding protein